MSLFCNLSYSYYRLILLHSMILAITYDSISLVHMCLLCDLRFMQLTNYLREVTSSYHIIRVVMFPMHVQIVCKFRCAIFRIAYYPHKMPIVSYRIFLTKHVSASSDKKTMIILKLKTSLLEH